MKVFVTKYALTQGIIEVQDALQHGGLTNMISVSSLGWIDYFHGSLHEWHTTKKLAIVRAELMRERKVANLHKKIKTLNSLTFT